MTRKLITRHEFQPIPDRRYDWCAYLDGDEELGWHAYGWGRTEQEAIEDWRRLQCEAEEAAYEETKGGNS